MDGKSYRHRFLILVIAALAVAGCSAPIGSIGLGLGNSSASEPDGIKVVPVPNKTYYVGDPFSLTYDHIREVYTTCRGVRQQTISPGLCNVWVIDKLTGQRVEVRDGFSFDKEGGKDILLEYNRLQDHYAIEVEVRPGGGSQGQTGAGIGVQLW